MDEPIIKEERAEDEGELETPGTTMVLTEEGWEASEFINPESDWSLLDDGSYLSPDGRSRTSLLIASGPR